MKALVLAAGKSTRIASVAGSLPKVLLKINGEPVLHHNLSLLSKHGVKEVWINLHHEPELIRSSVGNGEKWGLNVRYSHEEEILGTSGALKNLEKEFSGSDFLVLYGDNFTDCNLTELMAFHKKSGAIGTLALFDPSKAKNSGIAGGKVLLNSKGFIKEFLEGLFAKASGNLVNAGVYAFQPAILREIPSGFSDFGREVFPALLKRRRPLFSYILQGYCCGLDTPEAYARAQDDPPTSVLPPKGGGSL